jgi:hypothetical protein
VSPGKRKRRVKPDGQGLEISFKVHETLLKKHPFIVKNIVSPSFSQKQSSD